MDINWEAAACLAELMGAEILKERCPDCPSPLVMIPGQDVPFCPVDTVKRQWAQIQKDRLCRAKLALHGVINSGRDQTHFYEDAPL